jgi:hypothetical protein
MINSISKLMFSAAALVLALSALLFTLNYNGNNAHAVAVAPQGMDFNNGVVYTQSEDGKILYYWKWDAKKKRFERLAYDFEWK